MIPKKNRRGLSAVVAALMLILLVLALVVILWTVVRNLVQDKLDQAGSCVDTFDKVAINDAFTCYNATSQEIQFAIGVKEINVDSVIIGISTQGESKSIELFSAKNISDPNLKYLSGSYGEEVILPGKNSGKTFMYNMGAAGMTGSPRSISVIPIVGGNQCETSDSIIEIGSCTNL